MLRCLFQQSDQRLLIVAHARTVFEAIDGVLKGRVAHIGVRIIQRLSKHRHAVLSTPAGSRDRGESHGRVGILEGVFEGWKILQIHAIVLQYFKRRGVTFLCICPDQIFDRLVSGIELVDDRTSNATLVLRPVLRGFARTRAPQDARRVCLMGS